MVPSFDFHPLLLGLFLLVTITESNVATIEVLDDISKGELALVKQLSWLREAMSSPH
jgi:hypothetical protein